MANELVLLTQWRERLKRQSESGMTVEAFCQQEGVSTSMFYRWQRQLQRRTSAPTTSQPVGTANRMRNRCKILYWDRDGLVVWAKKQETDYH